MCSDVSADGWVERSMSGGVTMFGEGIIGTGAESHYGPGLLLLAGIAAIAITRRVLGGRVQAWRTWAGGGLLLLLLVGGAFPTWANARVMGQVVDEAGRPVTGAWVVLRRPNGQQLRGRVDGRGLFRFALPQRDPEAHRLLACASGVDPFQLDHLPRNALGRIRLQVRSAQGGAGTENPAWRQACGDVGT